MKYEVSKLMLGWRPVEREKKPARLWHRFWDGELS